MLQLTATHLCVTYLYVCKSDSSGKGRSKNKKSEASSFHSSRGSDRRPGQIERSLEEREGEADRSMEREGGFDDDYYMKYGGRGGGGRENEEDSEIELERQRDTQVLAQQVRDADLR